MADGQLEGKQRGTTVGEDSEFVVVEHPIDHPQNRHVHDSRVIACKKECNEITLEPQLRGRDQPGWVVGHDAKHTYVRTDDRDEHGRSVFKPTPVAIVQPATTTK